MQMRSLLVAAGLAGALACGITPALAQYEEPTTRPTITTTKDADPSESPTVRGSTIRRGGGLGVTGADVAGIAAIGLAGVGGGAALVAGSRRRARKTSS